MKKLLLAMGFTSIAILAHGQGTIAFGGGGLMRIQFRNLLGGDAPVPFACNVTVYFAETPGAWQGPVTPFGRSSADTGIVTGPSLLQIPGTEPGQVVSMQVYAWNAEFGEDPYQAWLAGAGTAATDVRQVTLAPTAGPGTVIWQPANGTNPNRFTPLTFWNNGIGGPPPPVPEPSTLALVALGLVLLCFRKSKKQ